MQAKLSQIARVLVPMARRAAWNLCFIAGSALVVWGVACIYQPAGFIVAGLEIAVVSFLGGIDEVRGNWTGE